MRTYTLNPTEARSHQPKHPERTARRQSSSTDPMNFNVVYQEWTNREAMARSIRMQQKREPRRTDWHACVKLTDGEGY